MPIAVGTRLGPYEISGQLGAGGMGEVYRAKDVRLARDVAVKVLPSMASNDEDRLRRFAQEARAVGALNHPNILTIFDVGSEEGAPYVVSELLEGATLGQELRNGPLPIRKAVDYATQIARGLAAAHEKGIYHRDLKPDNVFVTGDGRVKILDFGLAKLSEKFEDAGASVMPTVAGTEPGMVMGTVGYMSPEQVQGTQADHRSDIFSFGAVLYEMLSSRRAFPGDSAVERMNAILKEDPPEIANDVNRTLPPALDRIIRHCLEKKPDQRFQSARDLAFALDTLSTGSGSIVAAPTPVVLESKPKSRWMALIAAVVLLAASAALAFQVLRVEPTPSWSGVLLGGPEIALTPRISPDGKTLAFLAMVNNLTQVAVMDPTNGNWTILTQDRSRGYPNQLAWSADGSRIYFHRVYGGSSSIYSIPALGGEERLVLEDAEAPLPLPDGSLIVRGFNERRVSELYRFWPENSRKELLGAVLGNFGTAGVSRDGKSVAFYGWLSESSQNQPRALYDGDIDSNKFRLIASYEQTQDTNRFFPITSDQQGNGWITSQLSGDLFQVVRIPSGGGTTHPLMILSQHSRTIDSAPDGSLYIDLWDRPNEIVRFGVEGGIPELLAFKPRFRRDDALATVLPDRRILFETEFAGRTRMAVIRPGERLFPFVETSEETFEPATVISDNEVACMIGSGENQTVAIVSTKNGQIVRRLKGTMGKQIGQIAASPDGKTLYFVESQSIWAIPVADGEPRKLSSGDGVAPSPDGRYLVIQKIEKDGIKLSKLLVTGGEPEAIAMNLGTLRLWGELTPNAVAPDGRIVVAVDSPDSWFESPAVIDPRTGQVEKVPITFGGDIHSPGWTKDGRITASRQPIRSSIWRFRPEK